MTAVKERNGEGFGPRLRQIRRSRGLTQTDLAKRIGISRRVVVYYEGETAQPPGAMLGAIARALRVSADHLLGLKPFRDGTSPRTARLLKRLQRIEELPPADQRVVLRTLDALLARGGNGNGLLRSRRG